MGSIKYIHDRVSVNYIRQMFSENEIDSEINEILNKEAEIKLKQAQRLTKEKYNRLKNKKLNLLININSPEIIIGLKNSKNAVIFLPGKLTINNYVDPKEAEKIRRFSIDLQKTSLKFSRDKKFARDDWLEFLQNPEVNIDSGGKVFSYYIYFSRIFFDKSNQSIIKINLIKRSKRT